MPIKCAEARRAEKEALEREAAEQAAATARRRADEKLYYMANELAEFCPLAPLPGMPKNERQRYLKWAGMFLALWKALNEERRWELRKAICRAAMSGSHGHIIAAGIFQMAIAGAAKGKIANELFEECGGAAEWQRLSDTLNMIVFPLTVPDDDHHRRLMPVLPKPKNIANRCRQLEDGINHHLSGKEWLIEAPNIVADLWRAMEEIGNAPPRPKWATPLADAGEEKIVDLLDGKLWWTAEDVQAAVKAVLEWAMRHFPPRRSPRVEQANEAAWLYLGKGRLEAEGFEPITLDAAERACLEALIELRTADSTTLITRSGYSKVARILKRICEKYPRLKGHIKLPGRRGRGGYSTTIKRDALVAVTGSI